MQWFIKRACPILLLIVVAMGLGYFNKNLSLAANENVATKQDTAKAVFIPSEIDNLKKNSLFVFVGEKIKLAELQPEPGSRDAAFLARYKVLDKVYGDYLKDIIEFKVYDHYGTPPFSKHQVVLLFVSFHEGKFYHEKYQYFALYKTKDGKWASPYSTFDYRHEYNRQTSIKPVKIEFAEPVYYDLTRKDKKLVREWFPAPYYQVENGKAKAIYGNYIPELFKLKRNGVLKARDLF
ncbi:MAG TPA: hypothetical protein VEF04_12145 [Blastocatellia bacterium]|nr:hypothetical protein [Blastocatellia bacterium]